MKKLSPRAEDSLIDKTYRAHCSGMRINMLRIPALYAMARKMLAEGAAPDALGAAMVAFIEKEPVS